MTELAVDNLELPLTEGGQPGFVHRLEDLDVPLALVHDIVLRRILLDGRTSTMRLAEALALSPTLMERIIEQLRDMHYLEISGREGRNLLVTLSGVGRDQAAERMQLSRYAGKVPVGLAAYTQVVTAQQQEPDIDQARMRAGVRRPGRQRRAARRARPGGPHQGRHLPLRPPGHRQVGDRRAPDPRAHRPGARSRTRSRSTAR